MQNGVVQTARNVRHKSRPWVASILVVGSILAEAVLLLGGF